MLGAIVLAAWVSTAAGAAAQAPLQLQLPTTPAPDPAALPGSSRDGEEAGVDPAPVGLSSGPGSGSGSGPGGGPRYTFEVKDIRVEGLDWRGTLKRGSRRLQWEAGVTVWAVDGTTVSALMDHVQGSNRSLLMQAPPAMAEAGQSARTLTGSTVQLVVDMERRPSGLSGGAEAGGSSYQPVLEQMHNGVDLAVSASPKAGGQGLTVGLNLDETSIEQVHTGSFEDAIAGRESDDDRPILGLFRRPGKPDDPAVSRTGAMTLQASFQVPEVIRSHVEGSWDLERGEHLLVGLGARSTAEKWGRPSVFERIVLISVLPEGTGNRVLTPDTGSGSGPVGEGLSSPALPSGGLPAAAPPPPRVPVPGAGGN